MNLALPSVRHDPMVSSPKKGGYHRDTIAIHDNNQRLKFVVDDLKAISSIILTVEDHEEYANAYEALKVFERALISITNDIQEAIDGIDAALVKEIVQQD